MSVSPEVFKMSAALLDSSISGVTIFHSWDNFFDIRERKEKRGVVYKRMWKNVKVSESWGYRYKLPRYVRW